MSCQVCQKHRTFESLPGGVIFENEHIFVAHFPLLSDQIAHYGHIILEMKRHITQPSQMNENEAIEVGLWTQKIPKLLEDHLNAKHVYVVRIGDVTEHLHFHFVPRYENAPRESWGPLHHTWRNGPKAASVEMKEITARLKASLFSR